jgi:hypothetical protein
MAAPVLVGTPGAAAVSPSSVSFPTTLTPSTGSGYAAGDLLLCFTASWGGSTSTAATPAGWTQLLWTGLGTPSCVVYLFGKIAASASEPAPNIVWNPQHGGAGGDPSMAQIAAFRGAANLADVAGSINSFSSTFSQSAGGAALTTLTADDLVLTMTFRGGSGGNTLVAPSGFTLVAAGVSASSGVGMTQGWAYQAKATPGSVSQPSFSFNGSSSPSAGIMIALKPAPVGIIKNDTATGTLGLTGSRAESLRRTDTCSGALALSGTCVDKLGHGFSDAPVGVLLLSGVVAALSRTYTDARTGALVFTGTSVSAHKRSYTDAPSGNLGINGTAVDTWTRRTVYTDAPAGRIGITGTRTESRRGNDSPAGRLAFGGTAVSSTTFRQTVVGNLRMHGWAARTVLAATPRPVGVPGDAVTSAATIINPTVLRPPTGSGYRVGDVLICFAAVQGIGGELASVSPGWTLGGPNADVTGGRLYLAGKVAASIDEPPPTLTFTTVPGSGANATPAIAMVVAFRSLDTADMARIADVVGAYNTMVNVNNTLAGGEAITTVLDNDLVLSLTQVANVATLFAAPAGFGMLGWRAAQASNARMSAAWAYQFKHPEGPIAAPVFFANTGTYQSYGVLVALKGTPTTVRVDNPTGMLRLTGSLVERKGKNDKPQGALTFTGAADEDWVPATIVGMLTLSGSVQESSSRDSECTGMLALAGATDDDFGFIDTASGDIGISGTATDRKQIADKCAGVLRLAGVLSQYLVVSVSPSGGISLHGINSEFIEIEGAIYYDDFPGGFIEIDGKTVFVDYTLQPGRDGRAVGALGPGRIVRSLDAGRTVGNLTGRLT